MPEERGGTEEGEITMTYVIVEPCIDVKDKACVEVCPVDCIYEGPNQLFIHPDECIDCGACEPVCPVKAIFAEDETPEQSKHFIALNKQFFVDKVEGQKIALFRVGQAFHALSDTCTHRGGPLSEGTVEGAEVTCPWHGARFDIKTGAVMGPPAGREVRSYPVRVTGADIEIEV